MKSPFNPIDINSFKLKKTTGVIIDLPNEFVLKEIPATQIKINKIELFRVIDESMSKKVFADTNIGQIVLWSGDAYDTIGQWTDDDVAARITELYTI